MIVLELLSYIVFEATLIGLFLYFYFSPSKNEINQLVKNGEISVNETDKKKIRLHTKRLRVKREIKNLKNELNSLNIKINLENKNSEV